MTRRGRVRGANKKKLRSLARIAIVLAVLAAYAGYSTLTPTPLAAKLAPSPSEPTVLVVTLQNPTYKFVTGTITRIDTEVDIARGNGTTVLQSIPRSYSFTLLPGLSEQLNIPMISRVLPGFDYDIHLQIDGVGQRIITVNIPMS